MRRRTRFVVLLALLALFAVPVASGGAAVSPSQNADGTGPTATGVAATPPTGEPATASSEVAATPPTGTGSAVASSGTSDPGDGRIVELYPNPTADGNRGEYLVVHLPVAGNWTLTDGYHEASLPDGVAGTVPLASEPDAAGEHVDGRVYRIDRFPLAADGDRVRLRYGGATVDEVGYDRATEAAVWNVHWDGWRPYGHEPRDPVPTGGANATAFLLPDAPDAAVDPLEEAENRLYVGAYTFESWRVAEVLVAAAERGVDVRVVVEGTPVGGFPETGAAVGDYLAANGVEVRVLDGPKDRFAFHHPKYAVADDRAVVLTENWKPSGTGGAGSRGWGVTVDDPATADELAALFEADASAVDARSWAAFREDTAVHDAGRADGSFPSRFDPVETEVERVELLTAPGNAEDRLVERIGEADERVYAVVPRTGGPEYELVRALVRAAERGVETRLLLSGEWYDREENRALARTLEERAAATGVPLEVTIAEPRGRFERVHAKGLIVDDAAAVGSLNWNEQAASSNREVIVVVESAPVADLYVRAFAADWRGGGVHLPLGLVAGLGVAVAGGYVVARREVEFINERR